MTFHSCVVTPCHLLVRGVRGAIPVSLRGVSQLSLGRPGQDPLLQRGVRDVRGDPAQPPVEQEAAQEAAETELQCGEEEEGRADPGCEGGEAAEC